MVKIRKLENIRLSPGHCFQFFLDNPLIYQDLKSGKIIEVPKEVADYMKGIEVVKDKGIDHG